MSVSNSAPTLSIRAVANIEEKKNGRYAIVITEVPYGMSKEGFIEKVRELVLNKKLDHIADARDAILSSAIFKPSRICARSLAFLSSNSVHGDERKSKMINHEVGKFSEEELIPDEESVILMTTEGYFKNSLIAVFLIVPFLVAMNRKPSGLSLCLITLVTRSSGCMLSKFTAAVPLAVRLDSSPTKG